MKFIAPRAEKTAENRAKFMLACDHVRAPTTLFKRGMKLEAVEAKPLVVPRYYIGFFAFVAVDFISTDRLVVVHQTF